MYKSANRFLTSINTPERHQASSKRDYEHALENSVLVTLRHETLGSPEQLVMEYLQGHEEITNSTGRELTGIKSENTMKEVFYRLRDRNVLEQS